MKTLFVEQKSTELRYERSCLLIYREGKRVSSVPLVQLERIVIAPHVILTAGVLGLVAEKEVALLVVNHRYPDRTAALSGTIKTDVRRRVHQYQYQQDEEFRLTWAIQLIRLKTLRQIRCLRILHKQRPEHHYLLTQSISVLERLLPDFSRDYLSSVASLRGKEGAAAAAYFKAYTQVFAPALCFTGRNRRPPRDPVNVCLSLAYTLYYHEAINVLKSAGLDPALGCYHQLYYNRQSLACDMLEPLRPLIDIWVYGLFNQRRLRIEDFSFDDTSCLLQRAGKQRFYEDFRQSVMPLRRLLRRYALKAAQLVDA